MNAKVLIAAVAGLAGFVASADVLYWQVNNSAEGVSGSDYQYAVLRAVEGNPGGYKPDGDVGYYVSENLNAAGVNVGAAVGKSTFDTTYVGGIMDASKILSVADGTAYGTAGTSLSSLYFFLELFDSTGNAIWQSNPAQAYDTLVQSGTVSGFNANFTGVNGALGAASAYVAVPEPTSGLLMLIGMGALALRRRRA